MTRVFGRNKKGFTKYALQGLYQWISLDFKAAGKICVSHKMSHQLDVKHFWSTLYYGDLIIGDAVDNRSGMEVRHLSMNSGEMLSPVIIRHERQSAQTLNKRELMLLEKIHEEKITILEHKNHNLKTDLVRPELVESWQRCKEYGLKLFAFNYGPVLESVLFEELLNNQAFLLEAADPYIGVLENMLSSNPSMILLTDENGIILRVIIGQHKIFAKLNEKSNLIPGVKWLEETVGTCAHVISLANGIPYQIVGPEHYSSAFEQTSCSSAPIRDIYDNIVGTLCIVSPCLNNHSSHTLGLVTSMAWAIQNRYQLAISSQLLDIALENSDEIVLIVNKNGTITKANRTAREYFYDGGADIIGKPVQSVLGNQPFIDALWKTGKTVQDMEIEIEAWNKRLYLKTARPIVDNRGNIYGLLLTLRKLGPITKVRAKSREKKGEFTFDDIIGESPQLLKSINFAKKVSKLGANVLIQGESGTGKEVFAQAIHNESRAHGPFIAINCAAIPQNLIESELFGYEGGAFTGAERSGRPGKIELANGGTLFLDEIGDMPLSLQPVLLRVLEEKKLMRVGGNRYIAVDFQLIAASNRDLLELVNKQQFRRDLYYRLAAFKIDLPPLRERGQDIIKLAEKFITDISLKQHMKAPVMRDATKAILLQYDWPGNVRQLENCMLYAVNMSDNGYIEPKDLPVEIRCGLENACSEYTVTNASPASDLAVKDLLSFNEKSAIIYALIKTGYHVSDAAKILNMSRSTLYRKIKEYGLQSIIAKKSASEKDREILIHNSCRF